MRLPPLPADQWDDAARARGVGHAARGAAQPAPTPATCWPRLVRHPEADHARISSSARPPAVRVDAAAAHPRAGHPARRASPRLRLRVVASRGDRQGRGPHRRRDRGRADRASRATSSSSAVMHRRRRTRREDHCLGRDLGGPRRAPRRPTADGLRLHHRLLHRTGHGLQHFWRRGRRRPRRPEQREVRTLPHFPKPAAGSWTENYPGTGHRAGRLHRLDRSGVLRSRARRGLQADLAERRSGRAPTAHRQLLHQGAAVGRQGHVGDHRQDQGRVRQGLPQRLPPPRKQVGVERLSATRRPRVPAGSSPASTTPGATASTADLTFIQQEDEFFDVDKSDYGLVRRPLRVVGRLHLHQLRPARQAAGRLPRDRWPRASRATRSTR